MTPRLFHVSEEAGYGISRQAVTPLGVERVEDVMERLAKLGVDVPVLRDIWPLADAVAGSSLQFSIIRKRNAGSRGA